MAYQQQQPFFISQPVYLQRPPPHQPPSNQYNNGSFNLQPPSPPWATELLEEIKQIKQKVQSIDRIEETVNSINAKVSDLENKMKTLDMRVIETEKACNFAASETECNKEEMRYAKDELKQATKSFQNLETISKSLLQKHDQLDEKLMDLETRSMRDNLLFYGIPEEGDGENCINLVRDFCRDTLKVKNADDLVFDRAHRLGEKGCNKTRPIIVEFHYPTEREVVRLSSFALKTAKKGVGAQLPRSVREARMPLYPAMKKARNENKTVKFVGKKLYINGEEYQQDMEH